MKTIIWDIDDVLNDLMKSWFEHDRRLKNTENKIKYKDLIENPPHRLLNITERQYLAALDKFRNSAAAQNMRPNPVLLRWFHLHGHEARHIALTSRPLHTVPLLSAWVFKNFGLWIRTFAFVPCRMKKNTPLYEKNKKEYLKWLAKADILIDDSPENIKGAKESGIKGLLYPAPWNKSDITVERLLAMLTQQIRAKKL